MKAPPGRTASKLEYVALGNKAPALHIERSADGNLILDALGNPIPVMVTIPVPALMSVNGAHGSARFFAPFAAGGSHEAHLDPAELRLIAEWLDIGAQYYNNPFDVPQN